MLCGCAPPTLSYSEVEDVAAATLSARAAPASVSMARVVVRGRVDDPSPKHKCCQTMVCLTIFRIFKALLFLYCCYLLNSSRFPLSVYFCNY